MTAAPRPPVTMNEICNEACPLGVCRPNEPICPASPEIKLAIHRDRQERERELVRLPLYHGSGRWDRSKQRRGIRRLAMERW